MSILRIGIIGIGNMGSAHANSFMGGYIDRAVLCAVCDIDESKMVPITSEDPDIETFTDYKAMIESGTVDAVIIAVPHYLHPEIAIYAFEHGLHVLTEKPAGVYTKQVRLMNEAAERSCKAFGIMFNQRTNPLFIKAREIVKSGKLGTLKRLNWTVTNWYRTQCYYDSGGWRGSFSGEGGGVLINQAPHNLDLWQWIFGMPKSVYAKVYEGKYHNISVEDEAVILAEYENGATAQFVTSTGEYPGTNRLEIVGDMGKIVLENGELNMFMLSEPERDFCFTADKGFYAPPVRKESYTTDEKETAHRGILQNFVNHILFSEPLIAKGTDGINELILSNAAYLSSWKNETVKLPFDEDEYYEMLQNKIKNETIADKSVCGDKLNRGEYSERWSVRW